MLFDSHEEMWQFYKAYGKQKGFPIKKLTSKKWSDGIIRYATFACSRSGKSETKSTDVLKPKPIAKTGCDARIGGCVNEDGKWILRTLNLEHNHGLSPDKARYFPCNRNISASARKRIEMNDCAGINIAKNFNSIVVEAGAYENVSFLKKDCRNLVDKGCGLISHEDTETFTWLFEAWLSCMSNSPPIGIITDQDKAMQKAITNVFPTTRHRWCLWHIMKKVLEKLRAFKEREGIISSLLSAVYDSLSPNMFDEAWHDMMTVYNLWDNDWLNGLYEEWYRWVPCYLNDCFWAGMSTTQRSESMNAFFDGFVNAKTNLKQFVKQYENALRRKVELEWQADAKCFSKKTPCVSRYEMEKQVEEVYTISKFKEFQQELTALMYCDTINCVGSIYEISESFGQDKNKNFEVVFEEAVREVNCICSKFQFRGILCRHALTVLIRNGVEVLPEMYILARWRRDVMRSYSKVKVSYDGQHLTIQQEMYDKMCNAFSEVADIAADDESSYKSVLDWINKALKDLPKQIRCASVETTISPTTDIGEGSCSSNNIEHDLEEDASLSSQVPNQFSTQQSNVGVVPIYPTQGGVHNIYQPFPYNWQQQPLPPYALQPHYPSHSMTYEGSESGSFQHLLHQQHNENNNGCD
ncbi:protein FAR1-RELATED SEQUENCE [Citrus sinensis]|nr:protein FAR1-RELATED SEQUENCE [Citrus sinensis]